MFQKFITTIKNFFGFGKKNDEKINIVSSKTKDDERNQLQKTLDKDLKPLLNTIYVDGNKPPFQEKQLFTDRERKQEKKQRIDRLYNF